MSDYRSFYLKGDMWRAIRTTYGWKERGSITRFAEALGITRQYAELIVKQRAGCSSDVMRRIIRFLNIPEGRCWCYLFSVNRDVRDVDPNHPIFNMLKADGALPYAEYSPSAMLRRDDYRTETKKSLTGAGRSVKMSGSTTELGKVASRG